VKNTAYAWRQAIFWLSFCETAEQVSQVHRLGDETSPKTSARSSVPESTGWRT
jgi:hypothetical protein